mgnify:CR=1 FL=1
MSMPLHEIVALIEQKWAEALNPDTGEVNEAALAELDALTDVTLAEKVDGYAAIIRREGATAKALKAELSAIRESDEAKVAAHVNKAERLKTRLFDTMKRLGLDKAGQEFKASIGTSEAVDVPNVDAVPAQFVRVTKEPMKKDILTYLKALPEEARKAVTWATKKDSQFLTIR